MKIVKAGAVTPAEEGRGNELEAVNAFAKTELSADEVYIFSVLLCDNEVDRDYERFSEQTLKELSELFVGATGIADHEWKSGSQKARIYRTELLRDENRKTSLSTPYVYLKAHAYMLRTEGNAELIAEIEGGIKKETSVGCSVASSICSICGEETGSSGCAHIRGREYDGRLCYAELEGAVDAYEWSFVAVPAQKNAGVMKRFPGEGLKSFLNTREGKTYLPEYDELCKSAETGRRYIKELRNEVLRLSLMCDRDMHGALKSPVAKMDEAELLSLKSSLEKRLEEKFPVRTQLPGRDETTGFEDGDYII